MPKSKNTSFKGDVLRLVSGAGLAQIIGLLATPILTRLYAPDAFGVAALFASVAGILGVLACMRYELSIVLPDNHPEAANLLAVSILFSFLMAAIIAVFAWYGGPAILDWAGMAEIKPYLWLLPIMVLIHGLYLALNYWNTRTRHFSRLSIARVTGALATNAGSLGAGVAGHAGGEVLIAANIGGQVVATGILGGQILRDDGRLIRKSISWREMWAGIKRHRKFPLYGSWAGLLNTVSWQLPVLILGSFFSAAVAGFYSLGFRILQLPMSLIGSAISQVFHQRAADAYNAGTLGPLVEMLFKRLFLAILFPMLMLTIIGRDIYIVAFGEKWAEAGVYTQILGPWAIVWFISSPLSNLFGVMQMQKQGLEVQFLVFISRLIAIAIGVAFNSPILALSLFSITGTIVYGYVIFLILGYAGISRLSLLPFFRQCFFKTLPFLAPNVFGALFIKNSTSIVVLAAVMSVAYFWLNREQFAGLMHSTNSRKL